MARDVSEREFVNYARGLGNYCTYGDARRAVVGVLEALAVSYPGSVEPIADLLPPGVRGLLADARAAADTPAGVPGSAGVGDSDGAASPGSPPDRDAFLEILRTTAGLCADDRPGHALRAFLGTVKEKSQERRGQWAPRSRRLCATTGSSPSP